MYPSQPTHPPTIGTRYIGQHATYFVRPLPYCTTLSASPIEVAVAAAGACAAVGRQRVSRKLPAALWAQLLFAVDQRTVLCSALQRKRRMSHTERARRVPLDTQTTQHAAFIELAACSVRHLESSESQHAGVQHGAVVRRKHGMVDHRLMHAHTMPVRATVGLPCHCSPALKSWSFISLAAHMATARSAGRATYKSARLSRCLALSARR